MDVYDIITLLYRKNWNTVNQLYFNKKIILKKSYIGSSRCGSVETDPISIHEDKDSIPGLDQWVVGLIPGLAQWIKDPALL